LASTTISGQRTPKLLRPKSVPNAREVANLVVYLASDLAHFINGTMIEIDGGQQKPLMDRFRDR
jgi:3-oxoacyl-[acyl-carrier protein] reductase